MEQYRRQKIDYTKAFILFGLVLLLVALLFGLLGALSYAVPGFWRDGFSFEKIRPIHVSSAVFWILTAAIGSVLSFLKMHYARPLRYERGVKWAFILFSLTITAILFSYLFGVFGGREYWSFHPAFSIPIMLAWVIFIVIYLANMSSFKQQPVYIWMWLTGAVFFLFTYIESNLWWMLPQIRTNLAKDMTIQWKSYGSMVGSWNLLIYGSSIYLMDKIAGNQKYSFSRIAFALYFLSLFNLMLNWGHHVYTLPTHDYVKHIGYIVSMTELILFARIIYLWKSSLSVARKHFHIVPYRFLLAADVWVFLTLALAIPMSVPALNLYMHGTWVIVAHTMGATIGINSMLLLAFAFEIIGFEERSKRKILWGWGIANISLLAFWLILMTAGFMKAHWEFTHPETGYGAMFRKLRPWFYGFFVSGLFLAAGLKLSLSPLLQRYYRKKLTPPSK